MVWCSTISQKEIYMAKPNYQFEKRQREQQKKQKKAEKALRKAADVQATEAENSPPVPTERIPE